MNPDEGASPPDRQWALNSFGPLESAAADHDSSDARLADDISDFSGIGGDSLGDSLDTDGELYDGEVGTARAGRLVSDDVSSDDERDFYAQDVGVDGGALSAEEAAVHIVPEDSDFG